jgi:hypothetical protein
MAKPLTAPGETARQELVPQSFLLRFIGAFLDGDAAEVTNFLDGSVWLDSQGGEISRADAQAVLKEFFASQSLAGVEPGELYDLDSVVTAAAPESVQAQWGATTILRVNAKKDFSAMLPFWEPSQQFFIHRGGSDWFIFSIGQNLPPKGWKAQPLARITPTAAPTGATISEIDKEIQDAYYGCVSAFLAKDADGAMAYVAGDVRVLRMHQTISREEFKTTFLGYFDTGDFSARQLSDLVDTSSMFVTPTKEFAGEVEGPVYTLNVKAKMDLSDKVPFWTTYQRYYFVMEDGVWKIFAIF